MVTVYNLYGSHILRSSIVRLICEGTTCAERRSKTHESKVYSGGGKEIIVFNLVHKKKLVSLESNMRLISSCKSIIPRGRIVFNQFFCPKQKY